MGQFIEIFDSLTGRRAIPAPGFGDAFFGMVAGGMGWGRISMFIASDVKSQGTHGGTVSAGTSYTRTLNTLEQHPSGVVSLSSNEVTVPAGVWLLQWSAPAYACNLHRTRLYSVTNSAVMRLGSEERAAGPQLLLSCSRGWHIGIFSAPETMVVEHWFQTARANDGMGIALGVTGESEIYATLMGIRFSDPP